MSKKIKDKLKKSLNEITRYFMDDQNTLDMLAALKNKIEELTIVEDIQTELKTDKSDFEIPSEVLNTDNAYVIFSDGACRGNPGPGAWGAIGQSKNGDFLFESSGVDFQTTNNRMELLGAIEGLKSLKSVLSSQNNGFDHSKSEVFLYSDSKYVVDGMKSWITGWKARGWKKADKKEPENLDLWKDLDATANEFWKINYRWVKGHSGHPQNEYCDQIANRALDEAGIG